MEMSVRQMMISLSEYAVVDQDATILDALRKLKESQQNLPEGRQPHWSVLVRNRRGDIIGKLHHFAFLRALLPERKPLSEREMLQMAGVTDELLISSMQTLGFLTSDLVDLCEQARSICVRDVYTPATHGIADDAPLTDAIAAFVEYQTLSLLVQRGDRTVGVLRLTDLFDELSREIMQDEKL